MIIKKVFSEIVKYYISINCKSIKNQVLTSYQIVIFVNGDLITMYCRVTHI